MADKKIFKKGLIPKEHELPADRTHARAKIAYNILKAFAVFWKQDKKAKIQDALREIKGISKTLHDVVKKSWSALTDEDIAFYIGPRPHYYEDGKLAVYHPQLDNPLMQAVLKVVDPNDADRFGQKKPKLALPKSAGGIL